MKATGNHWIMSIAMILAGAETVFGQPPDSPWVFDTVYLNSGTTFHGLITEENPAQLSFLCIRRQPGRATVFLPTSFAPREVARIERLNKAEREQLTRRVETLRGEVETRESRLRQLELQSIKWQIGTKDGYEYRSDWFKLQSNAPEEVVRRAALRLEEVYAAFGRFLPARSVPGPPTMIRLLRSNAEFKELLKKENRSFDNTAFYDPAGQRIVCATDLDRLGEDLSRVRKQHQLLRSDLDRREAALNKLYKTPELLRHIQPIRETRDRLDRADRQNETVFSQSTRNLFATLTHEAFHAYVDCAAEVTEKKTMPRWLNEGLAQVFESAIVEGGELRLGHADVKRLNRIKALVRKGSLTPLDVLLRSQPRQFLADHGSANSEAENLYAAVWGLSMYLTFERRLLDTQQFKDYVASISQSKDPVAAFTKWIDCDLTAFEREWRQYLLRLQPDGSQADLSEGKK